MGAGGRMAVQSWSPSLEQTRFLELWRRSGGPAANLDVMLGDGGRGGVVSVFAQGVWRNYWMCDTHHAQNGGVYFGELHTFLPEADFRAYADQHLRTAQSATPHATRCMGSVGHARTTLTHRISVPVAPPPGAEHAIFSKYEWEDVLEAEITCPLSEWMTRTFGSKRRHARQKVVRNIPLRLRLELKNGVVLSVRDRDYLGACLSKARLDETLFFDMALEA